MRPLRMSRDGMMGAIRFLSPKVGGRILKTSVAIALSVMTARWLHLASPQFAGIVSVLAVQPSVYRSLRQGFQQLVSALIGAAAGIACMYAFGSSALVIGVVGLLLMGLHARWRWTQSLLVAVVIAINTMGSRDPTYLAGGLNQLALVGIGITFGNLINLLFKPSHGRRSDELLTACEAEVFRLLRTVERDLGRAKATPYVVFRRTIDRVHAALSEGKRVAGYAFEDQKYRSSLPEKDTLEAFRTLESMVERVRDINKTMQRLNHFQEQSELARFVRVLLRVQRRLVWGGACHFRFVDAACRNVERHYYVHPLPTSHDGFIQQATEYHLYLYLQEYYTKLKNLRGEHHNRPSSARTASGDP